MKSLSAEEDVREAALELAEAPAPRWAKALQVGAFVLVAGFGFWQFAAAGFDWRLVLEEANVWVFFFAMATLPVFGFPISACYIYAGMAFDPWVAAAACLGALAINMTISFGLTRTFLKQPITRLMQRFRWRLPRLDGERAFRFAFLVRTIPGPPFFFQNLALGLSGMPYPSYIGVSLLTQGSIAVGVIYCSSVLSKDPDSIGGIVALVVVGVLVVAKTLRWLLKRRQNRE